MGNIYMGVRVRQKKKGRGQPWWVFITHNKKRTSRQIGDRAAAETVASKIRVELQYKTEPKTIELLPEAYCEEHIQGIYFIQQSESGAIKIGISRSSIIGRLRHLQTANPLQLRIVGYLRDLFEEDEYELHTRFAKDRMRKGKGEWFRPSRELIKFIRGCNEKIHRISTVHAGRGKSYHP